MPRGIRISREDIINAGIELVRESGYEALSARSIATRLNCSTQPLFSNFSSMTALFEAVVLRAWDIYTATLERDMQAGVFPPYKASGMSYILFARSEPELFRLLFMRDRRGDPDPEARGNEEQILALLAGSAGLSLADARALHTEMWIFVHGLAVMTATHFMPWDDAAMSDMLSDIYFSALSRFKERAGSIEEEGTP